MSINPEDWDVDFAFPDFNLALFERERSWCRNWIVTFAWKKKRSVFENFKADHAWRLMNELAESREVFPKTINERIFDNDNKLTLKSFFAFYSVLFFLQGPTEERWKRLRERHSANNLRCRVFKILQRYIKELKLTALLVLTKWTFSTWRICFHFLGNPLLCGIVFCEPIKTFFLDACQMIVKSRVLHLFPVRETGRSHIINILLALFFWSGL